MEDWAKMVKEVRKQNGWTQKGLAKRLGVCCAEVNRWEKGHNEPRGGGMEETQGDVQGIGN